MKTINRPMSKYGRSLKQEMQPSQIFTRPKTAQVSFKKLSQILQGKYMSMQNKLPSALLSSTKNNEPSNRLKKTTSQIQTKNTKRQSASSVLDQNQKCLIEPKKTIKQKQNIIDFMEFDFRKLKNSSKNQIQYNQDQRNFVPYALQQHEYISVSEPMMTKNKNTNRNNDKVIHNIVTKKTIKPSNNDQCGSKQSNRDKESRESKRRTQKQDEDTPKDKLNSQQIETIESWGSQEEGAMHFSSLFKKEFRF